MGGGRFDFDDWKAYSSSRASMPVSDSFVNKSAKADFKPANFDIRESRDSDDHPKSVAIILGLDTTGSMGEVARLIANKHLGTVMSEIYDKGIVTDPQIMAISFKDVAVGDFEPVQVTQFESDMRIATQIADFSRVGTGGGGNYTESYDAVWYVAGMKTSIDCFEKRGKKGYLFTMGDERAPSGLTVRDLESIGISVEADITAEAALATAKRMYNVFHVIIMEGGGYRGDSKMIDSTWQEMLGERVIHLSDMTKLAEVITAAIRMTEGADLKTAVSGFDSATSSVISTALSKLSSGDLATQSDEVTIY